MDEFEKFHRRENGLLPPKEKSTWQLMKETASTPEEKQELLDVELKNIKLGQHYRKGSSMDDYENEYGHKLKPRDALMERVQIRKAASKFIKDREQLNRFVTARSYDDFKGNKTFESILDRLQEDK